MVASRVFLQVDTAPCQGPQLGSEAGTEFQPPSGHTEAIPYEESGSRPKPV